MSASHRRAGSIGEDQLVDMRNTLPWAAKTGCPRIAIWIHGERHASVQDVSWAVSLVRAFGIFWTWTLSNLVSQVIVLPWALINHPDSRNTAAYQDVRLIWEGFLQRSPRPNKILVVRLCTSSEAACCS